MAHSNKETIEIRASTIEVPPVGRKKYKPLEVRDLYIDGCRRATIRQLPDGGVGFYFAPAGLFNYQEAQVWILGLLELSTYAEELGYAKEE